ncbi:helix-turn-helix domain-containing protein [Sporosarcina beigongshangi]|uniref:helix-turn-helix domain-containing protein n=1 Tax=Sporosarcina beigongshangi TaxID=2782538 RepID=UPI00193A4346|nr:helix-turn-helix domain-containing protein [Sporosarcina beigongshangi]
MYQVVLLDDDVLVTEFMEKIIPWQQYGFHVAATFNDSLQAYEHLKENKCDVLITDIGMPRLNGIELITKLKEEEISSYNIILSCHDEFHFAQKALKLEVFDYILKESIEEDKVVELLERLKIAMDHEFQAKHRHVKITNFLKQNNMSLKTTFIEKLMEDQYIADDNWWSEQEDLLDMDFSYERYTVVLCFVDQYQDAIDRYGKEVLLQFSFNNVIEEVLAELHKGVQVFFLDGKFLLLFPLMNTKQLEMQHLVERAVREMQSKMSMFLKISVTSVIGGENQLRQGLVESMKLLLNNKGQRFYYPHGTIQYFQPIVYTKESIFQDYIDVLQELRHMIMNNEEVRVKEYIQNYIARIKTEHFAPAAVKDWAIKLVLDIKMFLNTQVYNEEENFMTMTDQLVQNVETFEHLQSLVTDILIKLMDRVEQIDATPKNEYILQAQIYIRNHLNEKISLKDVADLLHLNASYFSRLFKKETGESFVEFVTRIKMEKAKELLDNSTRSVEQIAIEVGFDSKGYFLKTFKQQFGMSPKSYKYKETVK